MKIKLVVFDLDGTLIDAYKAIIESFNFTMRSLKQPARSRQVIRRAVGWGDENLLRPFIEESDLAEALAVYRRHHKKSLVKYSRLFPKVRAVLAGLRKKGLKTAVASNRPTKFSWILIRHLKLERYFDYVLCADRLRHIKPHPEILNKIMQKFKVRPDEVFYVGDMTIDAQAGRRAKVRTVIVTTGSSGKAQIKKEKPYKIIRKITDLPKVLKATLP